MKFSNFANSWSWELKFLQDLNLVLKRMNPGSFFGPTNFGKNFHRWFGKNRKNLGKKKSKYFRKPKILGLRGDFLLFFCYSISLRHDMTQRAHARNDGLFRSIHVIKIHSRTQRWANQWLTTRKWTIWTESRPIHNEFRFDDSNSQITKFSYQTSDFWIFFPKPPMKIRIKIRRIKKNYPDSCVSEQDPTPVKIPGPNSKNSRSWRI